MCDANEKWLQKKFILPLVVSELAPAESSEPEVAPERVALAELARREVGAGSCIMAAWPSQRLPPQKAPDDMLSKLPSWQTG